MTATEQIEPNAGQQVVATALPEYWAEEPLPSPARSAWIPWPLAVLMTPLLWVLPKRMGLHWGRVAWPGVIAGHLLWTLYGIGCLSLAFEAPQTGLPGYVAQALKPTEQREVWPVTFSEAIRSPAAMLAIQIVEISTSSTEAFLLLLAGTAFAVAGIGVIGGGLLMPWVAGGERRWRLFVRCAKLTLWSTTSIVVLGLGLQAAALMKGQAGPELADTAWVLAPLAVAFWLWIWLRSGFRSAEPSEAPDFKPRRPLCEKCGYVLTGLTPANNCPECGRSVARSMPINRHLPAFAAARTRRGRFVAFFATLVHVVLDAEFFKRIRLRNGFAPARRFALCAAWLSGPAGFATYWVLQFVLPDCGPVPPIFSIHFLQALLTTWTGSALLIIGVISLLQQVSLLRGRSFRPRAIVMFYASAWAVPLAASVALVVQVFYWTLQKMGFWTGIEAVQPVHLVSTAAACGLPVFQLVVLQRRVRQALRGVRFTNA